MVKCVICGSEFDELHGWNSFGSDYVCDDCFQEAIRWKGEKYIKEECSLDFTEEVLDCTFHSEPPEWVLYECLANYDAVQKWCEENAQSFIRWL